MSSTISSITLRGTGPWVSTGAVTLPVFATAYEGLDRAQIPDASIITRASQQVGGSFGSAVLALILTSQVAGAAGYRTTFWWTLAFTAVALVLALRLPTRTRRPAPAG
jgi:hypothetical protein